MGSRLPYRDASIRALEMPNGNRAFQPHGWNAESRIPVLRLRRRRFLLAMRFVIGD